MMTNFSWNEVEMSINHWAVTPENGYLGLSYGGNIILKEYLNQPETELEARLINKLQIDVPYLKDFAISVVRQSIISLLVNIGNNSIVITI